MMKRHCCARVKECHQHTAVLLCQWQSWGCYGPVIHWHFTKTQNLKKYRHYILFFRNTHFLHYMLCSLIHILCGNSCVKMTPVHRIHSWPDVKCFIEPWIREKHQFFKINLAESIIVIDIDCLCWWTVIGLLSICWFWIFISAWLLQGWQRYLKSLIIKYKKLLLFSS